MQLQKISEATFYKAAFEAATNSGIPYMESSFGTFDASLASDILGTPDRKESEEVFDYCPFVDQDRSQGIRREDEYFRVFLGCPVRITLIWWDYNSSDAMLSILGIDEDVASRLKVWLDEQ